MVQTELFLDLYRTKFLDSSVKPFFSCMTRVSNKNKIEQFNDIDCINDCFSRLMMFHPQ